MRFVAGRGANGSDSRGTHVQVAARALMGSNRRGTNEVLLAGAPGRRAIGKQLRTKKAPAGRRADEMKFIVRSQREP